MGKLNVDAMKQKLDEESSSYSNTDYDKLQTGKNVRRVLWPKGDKESFFSEGMIHFGLGAEGKSVATCPKTFGSKERCPICEYVEELQQSKSKEDRKLADNIKAKRRIYINVISREDDEETPKVLPIGVTILKGILETICDPDYGDITDPEEGRDITITRKGQGLKTEYSVLPKPKSSEVSETMTPEEIEEEMTDLDSLFVKKSYEELEAILNGEEEDDEENGSDDEEENDYDEMDLDELKDLCKERGIKVPTKANRLKLVALLTQYDEAAAEEDGDDSASEDEDAEDSKASGNADEEDDGDEVKDAIAAALAKRKGKGKK